MIKTIPLNKLVPSPRNVRRATDEQADLELKADIEARGLLQNLVVTSVTKPKGSFAVEAGGRRLRALQALIEEGKIEKTHEVCCLVIEGGLAEAREASLAENFQRLTMNPADECLAFHQLIEQGSDVEGIARRFGLTVRFVEGRLRLASLAPVVFDALGAGEISLDVAKAYSLKQVGNRIRAEGMAYRKSHKPIGTSSIHKILRSRIYTGEFDWLGKRYQGSHQPLIPVELWERVQGVLDGRHTARIRGVERDFLFTGMIKCGHCGCMLVGDIKKKKYIYYRCSHYKRKCREPYVREEVLIEQFTAMLDRITMTDAMFRWVVNALRENFSDVKRDHDAAVARLQCERDRLRERMKQIYLDNLDDKIEDTIFRALTAQFRKQERKIARELELRLDADLSYMDEGIALMSIAKDAKQRFLEAELAVKKHVLSVVLSNCSFRDRKVTATYHKPFDIIAEKLPREGAAAMTGGAKIAQNARWLPGRAAALTAAAAARPDISIFTTDAVVVRNGVRDEQTYYMVRHFDVDDQEVAILRSNFIFGAGAVRRSSFVEVGGYDPAARWAADWNLWLRLILKGHRAGLVRLALYEYRRRHGSLTSQKAKLALGVLAMFARIEHLARARGHAAVLGQTRSEWQRELMRLVCSSGLKPLARARLLTNLMAAMLPRLQTRGPDGDLRPPEDRT